MMPQFNLTSVPEKAIAVRIPGNPVPSFNLLEARGGEIWIGNNRTFYVDHVDYRNVEDFIEDVLLEAADRFPEAGVRIEIIQKAGES